MSIPQSGGGPIEHHSQLAEYLADGCKPREDWRIGTEHEKFGYCKDNHKPIPYAGERSILAVLEGLRDVHGWAPVLEEGNLIGLEKDGANVSLEPGGQLELSGAPLETIHETCDEVNIHLREVKDIADKVGVGFIGLGAAPEWSHDDMPLMPKGRYKLMDAYMQKVGTMGRSMMRRTCTVQVNLDFSSEADMVKKFRVALALQPVATALFANSPFFDGAPNGHKSWRARVWRDLDSDRTGMLPFVFEDGMGFERYVDYALDVPMYFVYRDGEYIDVSGQSFRDFLKGELPGRPGEIATMSDWSDHLTTIFPEVRLKKFLEMRGADAGPWRRLCALSAMWTGLLYDADSQTAAWDLVKSWSIEDHHYLRQSAPKTAMATEFQGRTMSDLAKEVLAISDAGLKRRAILDKSGDDESSFLAPLHEIADRGYAPAENQLRKYENEWNKSVDPLYVEYAY